MLTPTERKIAAKLLRMAASEYANHGCNDFSLREAGLTDAEARGLIEILNEWNQRNNPAGFEADPPETDIVMDWLLMRCLADTLER